MTRRRSHKNNRARLTNLERATEYLRDVFPDRRELVKAFAASNRAAIQRALRRRGL